MVDEGEDCSDVLMQLSAVIGALQSIAKVILKDHLDHCVVDAVQSGDTQTLDDFKKRLTAIYAEEERHDRQEF